MLHREEPLRSSKHMGFSLITVSIILTVASLVLVSTLPDKKMDYNSKAMSSIQKLQKVEDAMQAFMAQNGRRPCPADGQYPIGDVKFGLEATSVNFAAGGPSYPCGGGTNGIGYDIKAPLGPDATSGYVVAGTIPTKTLGLADDYAFDEWGHEFMYVVDSRAAYANSSSRSPANTSPPTAFPTCRGISTIMKNYGMESNNTAATATTPPPTPGIFIKNSVSGTVIDQVMYAYVSYGPSGNGSYNQQSGGTRMNTGETDQDAINNAFYDSSGNPAFTNVLVKKEPTSTFKDVVYYADSIKDTCCIGGICTPMGFRAINTENGITSIATGDVNGDGIPDLVIGVQGAWGDCPGGWSCGFIYVLFGSKNGFPDPVDLSQLNGSNGYVIQQDELGPGNWAGTNVAVGDFNGDGIADIIFTEPGAWSAPDSGYGSTYSLRGATFVVFGQKCGGVWPTACPAVMKNNVMDDGHRGMRFDNTTVQHSWLGSWPNTMSLAVGDVNGDGVQDLIIGEVGVIWYQPAGWLGQAHVVFGQKCGGLWPTPCTTPVSLAAGAPPLDGTNGFELTSGVGDDQFPSAIAVGDVNNDGVSDIILTASAYYGCCAPTPPGGVYVVYGKRNGTWPAQINLSSSSDGTLASYFQTGTGYFNVATGDVNGDGIMDIVLTNPLNGNWYPDGTYSQGAVGVVFGQTGNYPATLPLTNFYNGTNGYAIIPPEQDWRGLGVTAVGDINGDGLGDILMGYMNASTLSRSANGQAYILYGRRSPMPSWAVTLGGEWNGNVSLFDGTNAFSLDGPASNCNAGYNMAAADLNGDGIKDIIEADSCGVNVIFGKKPGKWRYPDYDMNKL